MKALRIFYILFAYIMLQFAWWAWQLYELGAGFWMIAGEGAVFLALILVGGWYIQRGFKREIELQRQQQNFLLSITHELKSPLASLRLGLDTLFRPGLEATVQDKLTKNAREDITRLDQLVDNILMASRLDNAAYAHTPEPVQVGELMARVQKHFPGLKVEGISEALEDRVWRADTYALESAVLNLVDNAFKYGKEPVVLNWTRRQGAGGMQRIITVKDSGPGIPIAEQKKIFGRFYRVGNEETRRTRGTGLGLFIVERIMRAHGGQVELQSRAGEGTAFTLVFPEKT